MSASLDRYINNLPLWIYIGGFLVALTTIVLYGRETLFVQAPLLVYTSLAILYIGELYCKLQNNSVANKITTQFIQTAILIYVVALFFPLTLFTLIFFMVMLVISHGSITNLKAELKRDFPHGFNTKVKDCM